MTSKPGLPRPLDLLLQDPSGGHLDGFSRLGVEQVADHERRCLEPRDRAEGAHVGPADHVAIALLPVGELVSGEHVHVDVDRQEVVAALDRASVGGDVVEEVVAGDALAHEPALLVGEHHEHRVDLVAVDHLAQGRKVEHPPDHPGSLWISGSARMSLPA